MTDLFYCERYRAKITKVACSGNYALREASRKTCRGCPIGEAHAAGRTVPLPRAVPKQAPISLHVPAEVKKHSAPGMQAIVNHPPVITNHINQSKVKDYEIECPCGIKFIKQTRTQRYHSLECPMRPENANKQKPVTLPIAHLPQISPEPKTLPDKETTRKTRVCPCGITFQWDTSAQKYHSPECPARPKAKPAQMADAVSRIAPVRVARDGERGPQGNPKRERLRMNFTEGEMHALIRAAGAEHPADFARRAILGALGQTTGERVVRGAVALLPNGGYWMLGHEGLEPMDQEKIKGELMECLDGENVYSTHIFEVVVPTVLRGRVTSPKKAGNE
jgi:hypothetical protein